MRAWKKDSLKQSNVRGSRFCRLKGEVFGGMNRLTCLEGRKIGGEKLEEDEMFYRWRRKEPLPMEKKRRCK